LIALIALLSCLLLVPTAVLAQLPPSAAPQPVSALTPIPRLTLRVYNYARLDAGSLSRAEKLATAIFQNVGIETSWVDCATSVTQVRANRACDLEMGATDLVLRILPRRMAKKARASEDSLGFAQTCSEGEPACELSVFSDQVDGLATQGYRPDLILGYVIAHEVGHVLLGPGHSDTGIMRGGWTPNDLQRISWGMRVDFTGDQSSRLRRAVLRRSTSREDATTQAHLLPH
jgi:hypothetical protein